MKLIKQITDLNKAINKEKELGFVPTMGGLHKGHEALIIKSKKKCKKTLVSVHGDPHVVRAAKEGSTSKDLKILKKLKVDYVYLPTVNQIFDDKQPKKILLNKSQKILCAKFRKGHFEGVLDVLNRFVKLISPKINFYG